MSYHSRTRSKTVADISSYIDDMGICCLPDGEKIETDYNDCIGRAGYFVLGKTGGEVDCIQPGKTGCCCACSFVDDLHGVNGLILDYNNYTGGMKSGITECECNTRGGKWAESIDCFGDDGFQEVDTIKSFCNSYTSGANGFAYDVRFPGACCYQTFDDNGELTGYLCADVCMGQDCVDLGGNVGDIYYGVDWGGSGNLCDDYRPDLGIYNIACGSSGFDDNDNCDGACCAQKTNGDWKCKTLSENDCYETYENDSSFTSICWHGCNTDCLVDEHLICELNPECEKAREPLPSDNVSACCVLNSEGTAYSCSDRITEIECDAISGIWAGMSGENSLFCGNNPCPVPPRSATDSGDVSGRNDSPTETQTKIDELSIGDSYAGGIFMGIFEPGTPINGKGSSVLGNQFTGHSQEYESRGWGPGSKSKKKWAIIIDEADFIISGDSLSSSNKISPTSYFDGHYNLYGNNVTFYGLNGKTAINISDSNKKGYADWYIPSQDELAYIYHTFKNTTLGGMMESGSNEKFTPLSGRYLTSTVFSHKDVTDPEKKTINKQDIGEDKYIYSQMFESENEGFVFIVIDKDLTSSKVYVRLIRRILI